MAQQSLSPPPAPHRSSTAIMAIAEPEPKKNDVTVTSGAERKEHASSSTSSSVKTYDLYSNIKDFSFHMPGGWNDQDVGIFLEACWENAENLQNRLNNDNILWQQIAETGASKSSNPVLFTVNSCMEVAQCLRKYVTRNMSKMNNDAFKRFCSDIITLLPFFPPVTSDSLKKRGNMSEKHFLELCYFEELFKEPLLESKLNRAVLKHVPDIQRGKPMAWEELRKTVKDYTDFDFDARSFLEMSKRALLESMELEQDVQKRNDIFLQAKPYLVNIFDFLHPTNITKNSYLSSLDNTVNSENDISSTSKEEVDRLPSQSKNTDSLPDRRSSSESKDPDRLPSQSNGTDSFPRHRLLSQSKDIDSLSEHGLPSQSNGTDSLAEHKLLSKSNGTVCLKKKGTNGLAIASRITNGQQSDNGLPVKRKRGRPPKVRRKYNRKSTAENKETETNITISSEGTHLDKRVCLAEANHSHQVQQEGTKMVLNEPLSIGNVLQDAGKELGESSSFEHRGRKKREDRRGKKRSLPKRIMPSREARNRIISSVKPQAEKIPIYQKQTNQFSNNISETDGLKLGTIEVNKDFAIPAYLNPFVKLTLMEKTEFQTPQEINIPSTSVCTSLKQPVHSAIQDNPELAVLGKDVSSKMYNPDSDSAKTGPESYSPRSKTLGKKRPVVSSKSTKRNKHKNTVRNLSSSSESDDIIESKYREKKYKSDTIGVNNGDSYPLLHENWSDTFSEPGPSNRHTNIFEVPVTSIVCQNYNAKPSVTVKATSSTASIDDDKRLTQRSKRSVQQSTVSKEKGHEKSLVVQLDSTLNPLAKLTVMENTEFQTPQEINIPSTSVCKTLGEKRPVVSSKSTKRNKHKNTVRNLSSSSESDDIIESKYREKKYKSDTIGVNNGDSYPLLHENWSDTFSEPGPSNRHTNIFEVPVTSIVCQNYNAKPSVTVKATSSTASIDDDKRLTQRSKRSVQQSTVSKEKGHEKSLVVQLDSTLNPLAKLTVMENTEFQTPQEINIPSTSVCKTLGEKRPVVSSKSTKRNKHKNTVRNLSSSSESDDSDTYRLCKENWSVFLSPSNRHTDISKVPVTSNVFQNCNAKPSVKGKARSSTVPPEKRPNQNMSQGVRKAHNAGLKRDPYPANQPPPWVNSLMQVMDRKYNWRSQKFEKMEQEMICLERIKIELLKTLAKRLDDVSDDDS